MRRHQFDPISFVFGMIFAVLGLAFLSGRVDLGDLHLRWLWPVPLIAVGLALLVTTRRHEAVHQASAPTSPSSAGLLEPDREPERESSDAATDPELDLHLGGRPDRADDHDLLDDPAVRED